MSIPGRWTAENLAALGLLCVSLACVVVTGARVLTSASLPESIVPEAPSAPTLDSHRDRPPASLEKVNQLVLTSVAHNPFRADRTRASGRYGAQPGAEELTPELGQAPVEAVPVLRVLGVAVQGQNGGLAAVEVEGSSPRILRIGDEIAGFRLVSLSATEVRLESPDTTLVFPLASPIP